MAESDTPELVKKLKREGPFHESSVGYSSRFNYNVHTFNPSTIKKGSTSSTGRTRQIAYLPDEHNALDVVRAWIEENENVLKEKDEFNRMTLSHALNGELKEAWKEVRSEYDWIRNRRGYHGGGDYITQEHHKDECPFCGAKCTSIAYHLREGCPERE